MIWGNYLRYQCLLLSNLAALKVVTDSFYKINSCILLYYWIKLIFMSKDILDKVLSGLSDKNLRFDNLKKTDNGFWFCLSHQGRLSVISSPILF